MLARRLMQDLEVLWPAEEELEAPAPSPPQVKILQQWQDADMFIPFKMKGDPMDPSNYRGIFLLDVARNWAGRFLRESFTQYSQILPRHLTLCQNSYLGVS